MANAIQTKSDYLVVVQAPGYRVRDGVFAIESAFAMHLQMLRDRLAEHFDRLVIAAPTLTEASYSAQKNYLAELDEQAERIHFVPLHSTETSRARFWFGPAWRVWRTLRAAVKSARIVHSGMSSDIWRPVMWMADMAAYLQRKDVVFFVDIDFRRGSWMYYKTGEWSLKSYLVNRILYDPIKLLQVYLAPRLFTLVLFKSARMVREIGKGRSNVKNFFDTAHSAEHVVSEEVLQSKLTQLADATRPLRLVYFGRFVPYKGLDRSIRALHEARKLSDRDLRLTLIGHGAQKEELEALCRELELGDAVQFVGALPYGPELFEAVRQCDLTLATPLSEDTPRAAFDSMANGLPLLAFDTYYYTDLEELSAAVATATWPDHQALAKAILELDQDRERLVEMARAGWKFAADNTQERWLDQRIEWTLDLVRAKKAKLP